MPGLKQGAGGELAALEHQEIPLPLHPTQRRAGPSVSEAEFPGLAQLIS